MIVYGAMWWFCLAALWLLVVQGQLEDPPSVVITQGALRGKYLRTRGGRVISAFEGIPYAAPPVGLLRFKKPHPPGSWEGVRDATKPGNPCSQPTFMFNRGKPDFVGNEDCLYLNVYTHKASKEVKNPVLVFIHGGGFFEGRGDMYQPDFLLDKDIVLVTLNYRLGALGFLSMEDKELSGNYGLKDQTAALRWIRDNIAKFGGDPDAVTLCGQSAGAASVHLHMLSPLSKGLFHRAIAHSGSAYCPWAANEPGQLQKIGERLAANVGCNHHSIHDTLECLRDIPDYVLVEVAFTLFEWHVDPIVLFTPAIEPPDTDEAFLTADPWKLTFDVPWLAGMTSSEAIYRIIMFEKKHIIELNDEFEMIGPLTLLFRATAEDPVRTALTIKKYYFLDGDITPESTKELLHMYSDSWFTYPIMESFRRHKGPKYFYFFGYRGANSIVPDHPGVSHFDEMQYLFKLEQFFTKGFGSYNVTEQDMKMSEKVVELWTNFVIYGKPTLESSDITWEESKTGTEYLHIRNDGFSMEKDLFKDRFDFWKALPFREKYLHENVITDKKDEL